MRLRWLRGAGAALLASCSVFVDLADLGPADASSTDATVDGSVANSSDACGSDANLLCNPSFESPATLANPCGAPWGKTGIGTFRIWDAGHSGSQSCLVCGPNGAALHQAGPWTFAIGPVQASVWVAAPPSQALGGATITASIRNPADGGQAPNQQIEVWSLIPTDGGWVQFGASANATATMNVVDAVYVTLNSGAMKDAGACLLVDDVSLVGP